MIDNVFLAQDYEHLPSFKAGNRNISAQLHMKGDVIYIAESLARTFIGMV